MGFERIELCCGVRLPDYEAGYIALQLASASMNREMTYNTLKLTKGCMDIIRDTYGVELDPDQIDTVAPDHPSEVPGTAHFSSRCSGRTTIWKACTRCS